MSEKRKKRIMPEEDAPTKYVCTKNDLDLLLDDTEKSKFQQLFTDKRAWRISYKLKEGETKEQRIRQFLDRYDIKFDKPTVRDAVAFDLVKLDDDSVSSDTEYTFDEHVGYSQHEYDRLVLGRNFRIHLSNNAPEWREIEYLKGDGDSQGKRKMKRTVDRMYQGARMSSTILKFFASVFKQCFNENNGTADESKIAEVYVPFTNANDFTNEVALVPNTHPDFKPSVSRAYYDNKYIKYRKLMKRWGIRAISTFALVDPKKDKNHTGWFRVKVQRKIDGLENPYQYIVCDIDKDGQFAKDKNGVPILNLFSSKDNTILCVCKDDFNKTREKPENPGTWHPEEKDENGNVGIRDIPMVKSTTSSHYSIFRQRVPDYDLKQVRHYLQFKNRLEGMELCLEWLKRNVQMKEVQSSECFARQTMSVSRLVKEFSRNERVMKLVSKYYDLVFEYDNLYVKRVQLKTMMDERGEEIKSLVDEYNRIDPTRLDLKLDLGQRIKSMKMELNKWIMESAKSIDARIEEIKAEVAQINTDLESDNMDDLLDAIGTKLKEVFDRNNPDSEFSKKRQEYAEKVNEKTGILIESPSYGTGVSEPEVDTHIPSASTLQSSLDVINNNLNNPGNGDFHDEFNWVRGLETQPYGIDPIVKLDNTRLKHLIVHSERCRNQMFSIGYELSELKKMLTVCEDATIKVRRLVHNFEERMEDVESQIWDSSHNLKDDFSFTGISSAGLKDIILLHDWYACNAPQRTFEDMGFKDEGEFMQFRRKCNKISYNLRKNQYSKMLAMKKDRLANRMRELQDLISGRDNLKYDDKYGKDAQVADLPTWSIDDVSTEQVNRIKRITQSYQFLQKVFSRTIAPTPHKDNSMKPFAEVDVAIKGKRPELPMASNGDGMKPFARVDKLIHENSRTKAQYRLDLDKMSRRVLDYLNGIGLIDGDGDVERLVVRNRALNFEGDQTHELEVIEGRKVELDRAREEMLKQRENLKKIIDKVTSAELEIQTLQGENSKLMEMCLVERDRKTRNRMLINKLDNQNRIQELKDAISGVKKKHLEDFTSLERMRKQVDKRQTEYDNAVRHFKDEIGLNRETMENLMVGIYNRFQDEILNGVK